MEYCTKENKSNNYSIYCFHVLLMIPVILIAPFKILFLMADWKMYLEIKVCSQTVTYLVI